MASQLLDIEVSSPQMGVLVTTQLAAAQFGTYIFRPYRAGRLSPAHPAALALARTVLVCSLPQIVRTAIGEARRSGELRALTVRLARLSTALSGLASDLQHGETVEVTPVARTLNSLAQRAETKLVHPPDSADPGRYLHGISPEQCR